MSGPAVSAGNALALGKGIASVGVDPSVIAAAWQGMGVLTVDIMLALCALTLMLGDLVLPHGRKRVLGITALAQLLLCFVATFFVNLDGVALSGAYVGDALAVMFKRIFLFSGMLAVLGSLARVDADAERRQGEYYQLLMFSLLGMTLLAGARDLILLLVAFELMSIPLYAMAAFARTGPHRHRKGPLPGLFLPSKTRWKRPSEAGLKLFIVGAISSAVAVYGMSLVFGAAGSTRFANIANTPGGPMLGMGMAMMLAGFGFKIGAAPFHMWVPDTYQGAQTPFVAFLSVAPKAAGLVALVQLLVGPLAPHFNSVAPLLLGLAVVSVAVGNLMAVPQQNIKRLLGFSGVGQIGFALMALLACVPDHEGLPNGHGLATLIFFVAAYVVANMGIFFVVEAMATHRYPDTIAPEEDDDDSMTTFAGLADRSPWLAMCALLFLLSLGGIPFAIGFWAKLYVLMAVWKAGYGWLVLIAALVSSAGLFYYLQVARSMYMRAMPGDTVGSAKKRVTTEPALTLAIILCAALTMGVGLYPVPLFEAARAAAAAFIGG